MKRMFLLLVAAIVLLVVVNYRRDHQHDDTYLEQLDRRLSCADWLNYDDPTYGYQMRYPSCFMPTKAEREGNVRFVYVEEMPLQQIQYMSLEVTTEVCHDTLAPYHDACRIAKEIGAICIRKERDEFLMTGLLKSRDSRVTAYRMQAKYVLRQKLWFVQTFVYPEDFAPVVEHLVREVEDWEPFSTKGRER